MALQTYRNGERRDIGDATRADVERAVGLSDGVAWVDIVGPDRAVMSWLSDLLHLHPLAVQEAIETHTRPRLSRYENHIYLNCYVIEIAKKTAALRATDISVFMTGRVLVTLRRRAGKTADTIRERESLHPELLDHGPSGLLWLLLDIAVDSHFEVVQQLDQHLDALEDAVFGSKPDTQLQRETFVLRKDLLRIRRLTVPMREMVSSILRSPDLDAQLQPYFADVYDHTLRVSEWVDSVRDVLTSLLDAHLTIQSNQMNLVTKKVTSWAAIIAVPTLITGFFGQNVEFWGTGTAWGTAFSVGLMVVAAGLLYWLFKRNDWL